MSQCQPTRRGFLRRSAGAVAAVPFFGSSLASAALPNNTLQVAAVGVGGQGGNDLRAVASARGVRIVALCDVDSNTLGKASKLFPKAATFRDYRKMFDAMANDIDAVTVGTPDHMHAAVALAAFAREKHVYCEKPLAHNLKECRAMQQGASAGKRLITQMGTQIHSLFVYRTAVAAVRGGAIGKVREVHLWVGKGWDGPKEGRPDRHDRVPDYLDWNLWLGVAPEWDFVQGLYHPAQWRRWTNFGTGTLGDMGCHIFDPVFSALELAPPTGVISRGPKVGTDAFAPDNDVTYSFAGTPFTDGPISCRWTDGSGASRPDATRAQLPTGVSLPGAGSFFVGENGVMVLPHFAAPNFYSDGQRMEVKIEPLTSNNHYHEWANACRGDGTTSTPFDYACPVTETVLVGTVAGRFPDRQLAWNSNHLAFDYAGANQFVGRAYRSGWEILGAARAG